MQKTEIGMTETFMMVGSAIAMDIIEIIVGLFSAFIASVFSGIFQYGIFFLWFKYHGGSFFFSKKGSFKSADSQKIRDSKSRNTNNNQDNSLISLNWNQLFGFALESIPLVDFLPIFTINVFFQIRTHNKEVLEMNNQNQERNTNNRIIREKRG